MSCFQFKQFKIEQAHAAMKVSTDGILLGAWASIGSAKRALDIGTGTGLLALMLKQRQPELHITAVELEAGAIQDAEVNFANSGWQDLLLVPSAVQMLQVDKPFDLVISNPPYFNDSLKSPALARTTARHTDSLSFSELIEAFVAHSHSLSRLALILPCHEAQIFINRAAEVGLSLKRHCLVHSKPDKPASRSLMEFAWVAGVMMQESLTIHTETGQYSDEFIALCKAFYLKMSD
ncbi:tRNA1(Val) (adenine(37)-N6)-methyltransferase [Pseudoalteromonas fenneropenaei]|uniref:tRNA1(Val) (adenine(37)-N6)-methyltransferase n=1 Tax=Pseudoalteromonas fenneropenaei TaxID=1737459 RepID=A0ABV7CL98_9GAMM